MRNDDLRLDVYSLLTEYGVEVEVLLASTFSGGNRFQQNVVRYGEPIPVLAHKVYGKNEQIRLTAQVPDGVEFDATCTFSAQKLQEVTGRATKDVLTIVDRVRFDGQEWDIVATHYTGEVRGEFLVLVAFLKSRSTEYQRPGLRP